MGTFARCLCLILTVFSAGSRPSAGVRNGSPESDPWWGTKDARDIRQAFERARVAGDFSSAEKTAAKAVDLALRSRARLPAVRYLINLGGARLALFRYRSALEAFLQARALAEEIGDRLDKAGVEVNLSTLFLEMSDVESARQYAERAQEDSRGLSHPYFEPHLLLQLGKVYAASADPRAEEMFRSAIEAARAQMDPGQEARAWDWLGEQRLRKHETGSAERAFTEAFRIRRFRYPADVPFSYGRFGMLRLAQARLHEAARFTQWAIDAGRAIESAFPKFVLVHQRGEIERASGATEAALKDFRTAAELAWAWHGQALPAISTLTATNIELEKRVFESLVETSAREAVRRRDARLAIKSFEALEQNRAASLRETLALAGYWRNGLPLRYWDALGELRSEQASLMRTGLRSSPALERVRTKLTEMESEIGWKIFNNKNEIFFPQNSLIHFQRVLSKSEIFLSFHLGKTESYLWAVTSTTFQLYRLAGAEEIRSAVRDFEAAVRGGRPEAPQAAEQLFRQLFGCLQPGEVEKRRWLISAEDALLEAPLAALVTERKGGRLKYLIEQHSLRLVPGAMSLADGQATAGSGEWLGLGDPIYNRADVRWTAGHLGWAATAAAEQLNRLVGSAAELQSSAQSWGSPSLLLEGADATRERFQSEVTRQPAVLHLATHVLTPADRAGQALIAFGMGASGAPEFLTTADVAMLRVPGAVVTMTGCATGTGDIQAGAGLLGLTRAWQMAGAKAVVATLWPVADSRGELFASFYRDLRRMPADEAMQRSQIEMIRSGSWRASPQYWASFQVTGGAR